jgi:glycosyltransferase involved in cell wall biosynthesis
MKQGRIALSVIIPAYNEEDRLEQTIRSVDRFLNQRPERYEILVVDDGSQDATGKKVETIAESIPELRLIRHEKNQGKGWAVRTGMLNAAGAYRLFMDCDGSTAISHWIALRQALEEGADVAVGSRHAPGSEIAKRQHAVRVMLGLLFRRTVRMLFALGVQDTQNGFKAFTAEAAERVFRRQSVRAWAFDVEILYIAKRLGYELAELPVRWVDDERSKVRALALPRMLVDLLAIRYFSKKLPLSERSWERVAAVEQR